ncbi:universal stress protein [Thermodesulfobacteriota bacterium]
MPKHKILLPHNFSDYDHRALEFVVRMFSHADITLFNAYTPLPEVKDFVHEAAILDKLKTNLNQLSNRIQGMETALNGVRQNLLDSGFKEDQVHCVFKERKTDTAGEIIDLARKEHFDLIVINHKPGKFTRFFTGNVFEKIVQSLKNTAVCVVT